MAAIWASVDGRARYFVQYGDAKSRADGWWVRIFEAAKPVVTVMAWIERIRMKEWGGYTGACCVDDGVGIFTDWMVGRWAVRRA